jgi:hypothetical protein
LRYRYYICDVFTEVRFGGNQLAVLPEAAGLSDRQMQQIAREFNFSETTFARILVGDQKVLAGRRRVCSDYSIMVLKNAVTRGCGVSGVERV